MAETIIKIDLNKSAYENDKIHNRWHPDIPLVATVKPGDDFYRRVLRLDRRPDQERRQCRRRAGCRS